MTPHPPYPQQNPMARKEKNFFQSNAFLVKITLIGILTLLLLIPISMVESLIRERQRLSLSSRDQITERWSKEQTVAAVVLSLPFHTTEQIQNTAGQSIIHQEEKHIELLPDELNIKGEIRTTPLRRGIYEANVYRSVLTIEGRFRLSSEQAQRLNELAADGTNARLSLGISDLRGLEKQVELQWGDSRPEFIPNTENGILSGLSAAIDASALFEPDKTVPFLITLELKGSNALFFAPLGGKTTLHLDSDCPTPSFTGNFLPSDRQVRPDGFSGTWNILGMNRPYPQLLDINGKERAVEQSCFGVELLMPVAQYQMSMRSIKYAVLIVLLTFVAMLFAETITRRNLNPFQYLLVGLALVLFYSLLIALSEHLSFGLSYLCAAAMTIALLLWYAYAILRDKKAAWGIGLLLSALYFYIFVLLQMETWALLAGSMGLFAILGGVMFLSQKINTAKQRE